MRYVLYFDDLCFDRLYLAKRSFYLELKHVLTAPKQFKCGYRFYITEVVIELAVLAQFF